VSSFGSVLKQPHSIVEQCFDNSINHIVAYRTNWLNVPFDTVVMDVMMKTLVKLLDSMMHALQVTLHCIKPVNWWLLTTSVVRWQLMVVKQINQVDVEGCCPLVHAATNGHVEAVSFLLQCDWSQLRDKQPTRTEALQQALSAAARNGHFTVCNYWCRCCLLVWCCYMCSGMKQLLCSVHSD